MKRRILSIITALALCLSLCPTWALAAEADPSLCKHHPEHTEDCGYTAPTEGHDCGHRHTAECYTKGVLPDADGGDYYEIGADTENLLDCQHSHDSDCGYVQADPGAPCGYVCHICPIEALIAALPEQVTEDNADDVRAQLDHILDLYRELDEGEQEEINLSRIYALQGALDAANDPDMIEGEVSVTYQEASWNGSEVTYTGKTETCTPIESSTEAVTWNAGWYVVNNTVTISEPITVTGAVNLILADGCALNAEKGIVVPSDASLTIYAQTGGTGTLNATGTADSDNASAGIGGSTSSLDSGTITIHGGEIKATGGVVNDNFGAPNYGGAGIGGGSPRSGNGGSSGAITIYGGTITANSGTGNLTGAGIGGGGGNNGGTGSNITIYGGNVTAEAHSTSLSGSGAGIGGGFGSNDGGAGSNIQIHAGTVHATGGYYGAGIGGGGSGNKSGDGTVTISGGIVTAVGGKYAAGIGGGGGYSNSYNGTITTNLTGGTGSVTISGGIVDAKGGAGNSSGNYAGDPIGNGGNTTATATVEKTNAIVFENGAGTVCGDVTLDGSYTVPGDYTLNIPAGASLSGSGTLSGGSAFTTENLRLDMISVPTDLYYTGKDRTEDITTELSGELTKGVTICGQTFTVSGWTLAVAKTDDLHYTATYTNDSDNTKTVQKTITLLKSGTDLADGKVKTYKDGAECSDFTAGDTITVKATPTPTGDAPQKAAARLRGEPGTGQMALYVGDALVSSEAANADTDGSYTMTVSAADVLLAAGGPKTGITLTARFTANDNMADGAGTATVNITAAAVAEKDGKVIGYYGESNLDDAFTNDSATVTLLANVERLFSLYIYIDCTLDLGGHTITTGENRCIEIQENTSVTIRGEGEIRSENIALLVCGSATLEGGTYTSTGSEDIDHGVDVGENGTLSVTGEKVTIRNTGGRSGLLVGAAKSVQLSAGKYEGATAAIESSLPFSNMLAHTDNTRYAFFQNDIPVTKASAWVGDNITGDVSLDTPGAWLTGTVTVQACQHTAAEYTPNENDASTHTKTCLACGYTETGDCGFEKTADPTADSHTGQCPDCKRDRSGAHSFSDWAGNPVARTCTVCGYEQTAVARVEKDSTTTYVGALADAFTDGNSGATVTLLSEVDLGTDRIRISGSHTFTLDLNGQTVKASFKGAFVIPGGSLTIQDSGTGGKIESSNITIEVTGGTLSVQSGTVLGLHGVKITSGTVNISGGTISGSDTGLWVSGGGNITLSGGTFSGVVAVQVDTNASVTLKDLLASECAYHQNDIPVANAAGPGGEVPLDAKPAWLPGTVTVKECNHTGGLVPSENGYQHGGPCKCCGAELTAANHTLGADNQCSGCGAALAAKVEKSGSDTIYVEASNLASAFAAENTGATVTLLKDVDLGESGLMLQHCTFTLDCGAFTLSSSSENFVIKLDQANLTFAGGTIQCNGTGNAVFCATGAFTMTGGTLNAASDYALNCAYGGEANIQGGTVGTQGKGLCIGNPNGVKLSGGTYATICIASNYGTQKVPLSTILSDGRAAYGPDGPITRDTVDAELTGPIIVKECEHDGVTVQDQGNGKHGLDCPYCGYHYEHTTALTATASGNNVTLNGGCGTEGCNYAAELGTVSFTFENLVYGNPNAKVSRIKDGPASLGVMLKIDNAGDYAIQGEDTAYSYSLIDLFASTPMMAGDHTLKMLFYDDSNIMGTETVECELPFTVAKAPLTPVIDASNGSVTKPYDGTTAALEGLAITLTGLVEGDNVTATASYAYDNANAGERTITATSITLTGADAGNYTLTTNSATIKGTITKAPQDAPTPPTAAEVNDTSITLSIIANAEYSKDGTNWQASPTFTGLDPNRAYTFYARLKEDGNHNASPSSTASITTRKMMLDNATVTVGGSYTYTGAAQTPAVAVVKNGKTLTAGTDYTVSYANNTNAGTATVTITGMGDYEGTNSTTFTIQRKTLTVAGAIAAGRPYNGTNTVTITGVTLDGIVGSDAVSVDTANLTGTLNGSNVGSYAAVTLPALTLTGEKADNYTLTRPAGAVSTSVTISKAAARTPKTGDLAVANKQAHTYTFGLGALRPDLPAGMSFGSSAVTYTLGAVSLGSYYGGSGAKIEGQTLTLPIQAVESNEAEGIGTITVTIKSDNFEDMTATINVRSVNKTIPTGAPTLSAATLTYGQPLSTITLRGDMAAGATPVPGTFTWSSPDNRPAVQEAYAAAWVFTPTDNNTYAIVNGTSTIKVVPASVAGSVVTLSPTSFRYDGQTHSPTVTSVKLGDTTLTEDTDYTVEIPTETAAGTYAVTVTGKGNYTGTATATFTINPVEQKPLDQTDDDGHELRLEVETGLSTVPEALENDARYDTPEKIETALRTRVELDMSNVGENIAVFDVTLQYKDESGAWHTVDPNDFPTEGVTAILPYPDGTGATGYTFTVQHLISSGTQAGTMETLSYTLTADGLQCKFLTLSPVAIGYQAATKPVDPVNPNPGGGSGGGGGGVSTYAVTVEKSEHGKVTANRTNAGNGSTVTLTVTPDTGYVLDTLTVTDSRGNEIKLTAQGNGKYTFTMPGRAITVRAAFAPLPDDTACDGGEGCPSRGFTDLGSVGTWYHEAVDYVLRNNLMGGYGNGLFGPNNTLTRAQFAQILYNKEGRPVVNYLLQFTDVSGEAWYTEAVRWAASQGIVGGYADGRFGPNDNITREQLAVMLWRYAGSPAATDKELHFNDADKVGAYARDAMRWAVENGVISGKGGGILDPKGLATRAQTAQMLKNFLGK